MKRGWRFLMRATLMLVIAALMLELLLPYLMGEQLDPLPRSSQRARAFHRALFYADRDTLESLRPEIFVVQGAAAAQSNQAPATSERGIDIRTNQHGMRMRACATSRVAGTSRIAVLGDSVSFGWRVAESDCWPRQLEAQLRAAGEHVEVLNFAVPGFSTPQALAQFRTRVLAFQPDLVILATGFNDAWLRPGITDLQRLQNSARTPAVLHALYRLRRDSAIARAWRRWFDYAEPGWATAEHGLRRRAPSFVVASVLQEFLTFARAHDIQVVLADLCFPHARNGDVQRAIAERHALPFFDGRAALGHVHCPATPLSAERVLRVRLDTGMRERWDAGTDELCAIAFPGDKITSITDLDPRALHREGDSAWFYLPAQSNRDVAIVPRSYLAATSTSLERLMTLVYHRVPDGPREGELRVGRFDGAAYDCTDAEHLTYAHGEAIHPNAAGHARLGAMCAQFLRSRPKLLRRLRAVKLSDS